MNTATAQGFAKWLSVDQPELFVALYKASLPAAAQKLGDFTDVLSSIGSSITDAIGNVGSFLTSNQGLTTLSSLSGAYLQSTAAKNAVNLNLARAQAGQAPAPIQTIFNPTTGQYQAVIPQANGVTLPVNATTMQVLAPASMIPGVPNWAIYGGLGALVLILLLSRK